MRGIADGAGVSLEEVVLLNARYDLARLNEPSAAAQVSPNGTNGAAHDPQTDQTAAGEEGDDEREAGEDFANECTSAFFLKEATATGDVLNAQNWDMSARLWLNDAIIYLEIHPDPTEEKPSIFCVTEAGQLGRSGLNSLGIAVTANSLMSTEDFAPDPRHARNEGNIRPVMPISLLRRMVLESAHISEACTAIQNFPRHVSNNLTVATGEGFGACFEITPTRVYKVYNKLDDHYLVHSNHFTDPAFLARSDVSDRYPGGSSWFRRQRFEQGIRPFRHGLVSTDQLINAFSDHLSFPEALCCHPNTSPDSTIRKLPGYPFRGSTATVACVIYNLSKRTITTCKGPPCQGVFLTFQLEGPLSTIGRGVEKKLDNGRQRPETP